MKYKSAFIYTLLGASAFSLLSWLFVWIFVYRFVSAFFPKG